MEHTYSGKVRRGLLLLLLMALPCMMYGQSIKTDFDKKIILTDSLNLPTNTSAMTLITLLPELLERPSAVAVANYDIQIEGMSVGSAFEVALSQIQIVDIQSIEISESPISSYKNNGQGGAINLVLRSTDIDNHDFWGSAGIAVNKTDELAPQFGLGYRKGNFLVRGILLGEMERNSNNGETVVFYDDVVGSYSVNENSHRMQTQVAHALMQYDLSSHDVVKFNVSETYANSKNKKTTDYNYDRTTTQRSASTNINTQLVYEHTDHIGKLTANLQYGYRPSESAYLSPKFYDYSSTLHTNNFSGKLAYRLVIYNHMSGPGHNNNANLELGCNFNYMQSRETAAIKELLHSDEPHRLELTPVTRSDYYMPYLVFDCAIGKLRLKTTAEFQHLNFDIHHKNRPGSDDSQDENSYSGISNTVTGKFMAEWHFARNRNMRLILNRSLERPTDEQLYPYMIFSPKNVEYVKGNAALTPMLTHELTLDYIANFRWKTHHSLIVNAGASMNRVTDIINRVYPEDNKPSGGLGATLRYASFANGGSDDIASANLMALYSYKAFSLSFTGNMYHRMHEHEAHSNHHTYYNLSLFPYFRLKDGWHGGARLVYSSRVVQTDGTLGDCAVATITVGKAWNHLSVYLSQSMPFNPDYRDVVRSGNQRTVNTYQVVENKFLLGMKYSF